MLGGVEVKRSKKHKKKSKKHKLDRDDGNDDDDGERRRSAKEEAAALKAEEAAAPPIVVQSGRGRISTSNMTVQGHEGTKFLSELSVGDAIIVTHPTTHCDETRIVKMVLSDVSIGISSAFSTDLISTCTFRFVKAPPSVKSADDPSLKKRRTGAEEDDRYGAMEGLKADGDKFMYRVMRKGKTGYDIVTEDRGDRSREDLLNKRSKAKSDRFCM